MGFTKIIIIFKKTFYKNNNIIKIRIQLQIIIYRIYN